MEELEDAIVEVLITERAPDPELRWLIRIAFVSIYEKRPVFPNPLDEPVLFGKFIGMVKEGLEDARSAQEEISKAQDGVLAKIPGLKFPT